MAATRELTSAHWGVYEVVREAGGATLKALAEDPDPSPIGLGMLEAYRSPVRVQRPAIRKSWLERGPGASPELRGREPFIEVPWAQALDLVAKEIERVRTEHGNESIFGGSYGWSSAGRFHHAQSQVHRFLNVIGGYVRHVDSYSLAAARVLLPHVLASWDELSPNHHSWAVMEEHTRLMVCFGGVPQRNGQVSPGGNSEHRTRQGLGQLARAGCRFVNLSPMRSDLVADNVEWIPIRPHSDTAVMLALVHAVIARGRQDDAFLRTYCTGYEQVRAYVMGEQDGVVKDARWASALSGVPAERLERLAMDLCDTRSMVNVAWSLQRADHGEQPFWAAITLAAVCGHMGLPGGGFGVYGPIGTMGSPHHRFAGPVLPQGRNAIDTFIPAARLADMLLHPGKRYDYNGARLTYPDIRLVYWAGGNPFHHHQDLNRLVVAWRKPESIVVHEQVWNAHARMADVVLPATSTVERADLGYAIRDPLLVAMKRIVDPPGEARDDYAIFTDLATRLGAAEAFTEGRDTMQWLAHLYEGSRPSAAKAGAELPPFDAFWTQGSTRLPDNVSPLVMLEAFRRDPVAHPLHTPSGKIELHSQRIEGFGYADCRGQATWYEPAEWLGAAAARDFPIHLLSPQPGPRLHSQLDFSRLSLGRKVAGREPVHMSPADAVARGIAAGDVVRVFNARGACLAGAVVTDDVMPGVMLMHTGAWYDPEQLGVPGGLDKHGNVNVLARDVGASSLSQGCSAQSCLVQVERFAGTPPPITAFDGPAFETRPE